MKATNMTFLICENKKNHRCLCCLAKITLKKAQYLACLWLPKGTLLPLKFFLEGTRAQRAIAPSL